MSSSQRSSRRKYYLEILGLDEHAEFEDVKASYRKLAMHWHPDKNNSPDATERFQEIAQAYRYLTTDDDDLSVRRRPVYFLTVFVH